MHGKNQQASHTHRPAPPYPGQSTGYYLAPPNASPLNPQHPSQSMSETQQPQAYGPGRQDSDRLGQSPQGQGLAHQPPSGREQQQLNNNSTWAMRHRGMDLNMASRFYQNEVVQVNITTHGWVAGVVVGFLEFVNAVTSRGYRVQYRIPEGRMEDDFPAHPDYIRPNYS